LDYSLENPESLASGDGLEVKGRGRKRTPEWVVWGGNRGGIIASCYPEYLLEFFGRSDKRGGTIGVGEIQYREPKIDP